MEYNQKKYVGFAYNSGNHWIDVVIVPSWHKVLYLDSNRGGKTNLSPLVSVIDEWVLSNLLLPLSYKYVIESN